MSDIANALDQMLAHPKKTRNGTLASVLLDEKEKIQKLFQKGWSIKDIYKELKEKNLITASYSQFRGVTSPWRDEIMKSDSDGNATKKNTAERSTESYSQLDPNDFKSK